MISLKKSLTKILIKDGLITQKQLDYALDIQKKEGGRLSDLLIKLKIIDEKELVAALSHGLSIPPINLSKLTIDSKITQIISSEVVRNYQVMPVSLLGNSLTIAMADPLNVFAIDDIRTLTGFEINPIIATQKDIREAIEEYYSKSANKVITEIAEDINKLHLELIQTDVEEENVSSQELIKLTQEAPVVKITNMLLAQATKQKASDILIEPLEKTMRVRYRIDGILKEVPAPPKSLHESIVSRIKVISELDIAERRIPQDGRFKIKLKEREVDFRVSILPSSSGEKVALRVLDKSQATLDIEKLGFDSNALSGLKKAALMPHGMILVCGPTGCGKTTTLYSILKYVDSPQKNIVTVEDPVEYQLKGINQVTSKPDIGLSFANALRSILRQDPDTIMIGEIRDYETVDIAIKSALTGHLVLSTLHTTNAAGSIIRLINMGVEAFLIASSLIMVAAQRLVRKICSYCKESYTVDTHFKKGLGIENLPSQLFRGKGCSRCFNAGFSGRIGIIEVLVVTAEIREKIYRHASEAEIKQEARRQGMKTLRENGIVKVKAGITTIEEILRVTAPD